MTGPEVVVHEPDPQVTLATLEDEVVRALGALADATERGAPAVVLLDDAAVAGHAPVAPTALAHALVGLVRALALEGRRPGWRVNALALPAGAESRQRDVWIERLAEPEGASGTLLRLGHGHLGKVPA
jgi:NAD(P)-dependent dehydrogenase (short-subunit alcohol dehydrogenase family)